ncbi:hypothetical protein TWF788_010442 [Orbilia oligospora]|uniref:Uncharacterized protein n=1 Tax=Orbilia oligospora TaxID=2813651 RepID=A0A7C8KIE9_ORBOL|nr:hypothetical protein TWF788_010442 [Orbilia oligospora]
MQIPPPPPPPPPPRCSEGFSHLQPLTHVVSANYFQSEGGVGRGVSTRPTGLILQLGKNARVRSNHVAGNEGYDESEVWQNRTFYGTFAGKMQPHTKTRHTPMSQPAPGGCTYQA